MRFSPAVHRRPRARDVLDRIGAQNLTLGVTLIALVVFFRAQSATFLLAQNLLNIGVAVSLLGVLSVVEMVVIVSGGLDISVGSMTGLASVVAATALTHGNHALVGIAAALAAGALAGLFNGLVITFGRVNPVIATLATYSAYQGVAFLVVNGQPVGVANPTFNTIGSARVAGIPVPVVILLVVIAVFFLALRYTDFGRNIYALGGNETAARLCGINLTRYKLAIYTISGLVAGLAGIMLAAQTGTGQPTSGSQGLELAAITAALLGGAALTGGRGTVVGTVLAVALIGALDNGLTLLNVQTFWQLVAHGALLVIAVVIQEWRAEVSGRVGAIRAIFASPPFRTQTS